MGATNFSTYGLGKTAREAFSHAQDEARYRALREQEDAFIASAAIVEEAGR
jgi:hypothetical protein